MLVFDYCLSKIAPSFSFAVSDFCRNSIFFCYFGTLFALSLGSKIMELKNEYCFVESAGCSSFWSILRTFAKKVVQINAMPVECATVYDADIS